MRLRLWILIMFLTTAIGCQRQSGSAAVTGPLSAADRTAVEQSVRGFMNGVARDVSKEGPTAWAGKFESGPDFFMASDGVLAFPSGEAAAQGIAALPQIIKHIELQWGDLRVDALTGNLAMVGAQYQEVRTDPNGHETTEKGYFTGLAEKRDGTWKFRDTHWSVEAPGPKSERAN
jgi:hypothetical protein